MDELDSLVNQAISSADGANAGRDISVTSMNGNTGFINTGAMTINHHYLSSHFFSEFDWKKFIVVLAVAGATTYGLVKFYRMCYPAVEETSIPGVNLEESHTMANERYTYKPSVHSIGQALETTAQELNELDPEVLPHVIKPYEMPESAIKSAEAQFDKLHQDRPKPGDNPGGITEASHSYNQTGMKITLGELTAKYRLKTDKKEGTPAAQQDKSDKYEESNSMQCTK